MTKAYSTSVVLILASLGVAISGIAASTQAPPAGAPPAAQAGGPAGFGAGGQGGRGRGGLPGATPEQTQAVTDMNAALVTLSAAVTAARTELATATFANVKNLAAITAAVEKVRVAELALATKRAEEFTKLQAGPNKLNADQVTALIAAGASTGGGGRGGRGGL